MTRKDDRTPEQCVTHQWAVVGLDRCLSGWGGAARGASRAAWAVNPATVNLDRVERWVRSRGDMRYVNVVDLTTYRPPRGTAHFHVYVVEPDHPAATY